MFHAYLFYSGNCREAFTRYQEIFGGELFLMPMSEVPDGEAPEGQADMIIHGALTLETGALLMASDDPTGDAAGVKGISVSYTSKDPGESKRVFDMLAEGGEVTQELTQTFFSPMFGMCVDRFGIPWMINTEDPNQAAG
jgi:PhnB protein